LQLQPTLTCPTPRADCGHCQERCTISTGSASIGLLSLDHGSSCAPLAVCNMSWLIKLQPTICLLAGLFTICSCQHATWTMKLCDRFYLDGWYCSETAKSCSGNLGQPLSVNTSCIGGLIGWQDESYLPDDVTYTFTTVGSIITWSMNASAEHQGHKGALWCPSVCVCVCVCVCGHPLHSLCWV
jgi:hypothetical protein